MKKNMIKVAIIAAVVLTFGLTFTLSTVSADAVYDTASINYGSADALSAESYTLEEMLVYALQDEYMAQAEYQAIISTYGEIRPFTNIILAEGTHISLLLPLFEAYGVTLPENTAVDYVVVPDSVTSALATGVQAEEMNIAMYAAFLSQDLPDDVRDVFTALQNASYSHLAAFSKDRYIGVGTDLMNQVKNMFKKSGTSTTKVYNNYQTCINE